MTRTPTRLAALLLLITVSACGGPDQDITKLLTTTEVRTGYFDAGIENGMNKLVPAITLTLKNVGQQPVSNVQLNAVIRRAGEAEEWGGAFTKAIGGDGIPPGGSSKPIVLRSNLGYTSTEPRAKMLQHKQFVDASLQLFAKHGGKQWVKLGEWPIARDLLTQ